MSGEYEALKITVYPWMIRRWAETKGADRKPLVELRPHVIEDVRLTYMEPELERLTTYITQLKASESDYVSTVVHGYRQACLSMTLAENEYEDGTLRKSWDPKNYHASPGIRWQRQKRVPILLGKPVDGMPNKAVIFTPLPGEAAFVHWYLMTFHRGLKPFLFIPVQTSWSAVP